MQQDIIKSTKFIIYSRKSSEDSSDKQALSIQSQINENNRLIKRYNIPQSSVEYMQESKSAKKSGTRPIFNSLVQKIESGKIDGIIVWHPDRLSRNAGDVGRLIDLMDDGKLKCIVTHQQTYLNRPSDKAFFGMICTQAKMENDNKSENVKRGYKRKCELGYLPTSAKVGYKNDFGEKGYCKMLDDPERLPLVQKALKMFLTGNYSINSMYEVCRDQLKIVTVQKRRLGGRPLSRSAVHNMLRDSFYAGFFYHKDEFGESIRYETNKSLTRIITEAEHYKIQALLGNRGKPKPKTYVKQFPYKRFSKTPDNIPFTAEPKFQVICPTCKYKFAYQNKTHCPKCNLKVLEMINAKYLDYVYYHPIKRDTGGPKNVCITEKEITEQVLKHFDSSWIAHPVFTEWIVEKLKESESEEKQLQTTIKDTVNNQVEDLKLKLDKLTDMKLRDMIDDDEFLAKKDALKAQIKSVEQSNEYGEKTQSEAKIDLYRAFSVTQDIESILKKGDYDEVVELLSIFGSNLKINGKVVNVYNDILIQKIEKAFSEIKQKNALFEPKNLQDLSDSNPVFVDVRPDLLLR